MFLGNGMQIKISFCSLLHTSQLYPEDVRLADCEGITLLLT